MLRLGVVVHPNRPLDRALATLRAWTEARGAGVVQIRIDGQERVVAPAGDAAECDLVVALGGDGTTLAALHAAAPHRLPVLGIACGSVGALTATSADATEQALEKIAAGEWQRRVLPGLGVSADGGEPHVAINDLVVVRNGANQVVVGVHVDDELYVRFAGDGVVLSTPLGSSAYTMAAGGPVLAAGTEAIVVTPVAAHGGSTPPLVVGAQSTVTIAVEGGFGGARIEFDGQIKDLVPSVLTTSWHADYATLVRFDGGESVLAGLRRRRILMDSPRVQAREERAAASGGAAGVGPVSAEVGATSAGVVGGAGRGPSASRE
jgi:NAD+ kinase